MMSKGLLRARTAMTTIIRNSSHRDGGVAGENLPFRMDNKYKLTLYFALFVGSGLAVPFLTVRHQVTKNN